ncbi:MAG: hypothetical protein V7651_06920 [Hyphomonas oceanitis]|uniref:hypothetical protein n=1 Tax=Hyphomonas oceanitis TaxID=81033 RepID=UPI0030010A13
MMMSKIKFPQKADIQEAQWAPILLEPIEGSYERLVIGVAVLGASDYHIESANALHRLECFYGINAPAIEMAIQMTCEHLKHDIMERGTSAIMLPKLVLSSASLGEVRVAQGASMEVIARSWMKTLSSIYETTATKIPDEKLVQQRLPDRAVKTRDSIPELVLEYVDARNSDVVQNFNRTLIEGHSRRSFKNSHEVVIDYSGKNLFANFGSIEVGKLASSVDKIKRRLWDLKVHRDNNHRVDAHQMLIHRPPQGSKLGSQRQIDNIEEAVESLEQQADQEEIRLLAFTSVEAIGERLLKVEQAA